MVVHKRELFPNLPPVPASPGETQDPQAESSLLPPAQRAKITFCC